MTDQEDSRPELRLPAEITVLGNRYHLAVVDDVLAPLGRAPGAEHALGMTDLNRGTIRIRGNGEQSEDAVRDTLLHEVIHAVAYHMSVDLEEEDVARLATGLLLTIRTNPELVLALVSR